MGLKRGMPRPALVVPDVETSLAFGGAADEWVATEEPGRARLLVLPERVPDELVAAVRSAWSLMPKDSAAWTYALAVGGVDADDVLGAGHDPHQRPNQDGANDHGHHGGDDEGHDHDGQAHDSRGHDAESGDASEKEGGDDSHDHAGHGGHDHGDMMAITGEPSADGLVMESMDVQAGPLGVSLPGGLLVQASLDGDVVAECRVGPTLTAGESDPPDPWSAVAWTVAELAATEGIAGVTPHAGRWFRVAAVEIERAVSHLAWLHGFCRLLGWEHMTDRVRTVLTAVVSTRAGLPVSATMPDLPDVAVDGARDGMLHARDAAGDLADALETSRAFARRTAGLAGLTVDDATSRGLAGPAARASGVAEDARTDDPGYARLRFAPIVRDDGDARARALVRAAEAAQSLELAAGAIAHAGEIDGDEVTPWFGRPHAGLVESARGPVRVLIAGDGTPRRRAPGVPAARHAAGNLALGREWAAALVTVASFDISPWRVGA